MNTKKCIKTELNVKYANGFYETGRVRSKKEFVKADIFETVFGGKELLNDGQDDRQAVNGASHHRRQEHAQYQRTSLFVLPNRRY